MNPDEQQVSQGIKPSLWLMILRGLVMWVVAAFGCVVILALPGIMIQPVAMIASQGGPPTLVHSFLMR